MGAEIGGRGGMKRRRDAVEEQRRDRGRGGNGKIGYVTTTDWHIETLWVLDRRNTVHKSSAFSPAIYE